MAWKRTMAQRRRAGTYVQQAHICSLAMPTNRQRLLESLPEYLEIARAIYLAGMRKARELAAEERTEKEFQVPEAPVGSLRDLLPLTTPELRRHLACRAPGLAGTVEKLDRNGLEEVLRTLRIRW